MASPTTTIGSQFVGHWDAVPAHWFNVAGNRQYQPSTTRFSSQPTQLEFIPIAGCRIQGWSFFSNLNDGDFWNFNNSTRKPPGGLVSAFFMPDNDGDLDHLKAVRVANRDLIEFEGTANTGNGYVITLSRGRNGRGGTHPSGGGGGSNISPAPPSAAMKAPPGYVPLHIRAAGNYPGSGTTLSTGLAFTPAHSLRWQCYWFPSVNNGNTWTTADSIPPPNGMVTAAWMADDLGGTPDFVSVRLEGSRQVKFTTAAGGRSGWLLVGCR